MMSAIDPRKPERDEETDQRKSQEQKDRHDEEEHGDEPDEFRYTDWASI